jgi:hypothetical protein
MPKPTPPVIKLVANSVADPAVEPSPPQFRSVDRPSYVMRYGRNDP